MAKKSAARDAIVATISMQEGVFHPSLIAGLTSTSVPYVQNVINTLVATKKLVEKKQGRKTLFELVRDKTGSHTIQDEATETNEPEPIEAFSVAERFGFVEKITQMTLEKCIPSMFLTGPSGIGKTHAILEHLKLNGLAEGEHFVTMKGHVSPFGLYSILYHNQNNGLVIFDDCDRVFENEQAGNILKAALDSYATRRVTWFSRTIPDDAEIEREFIFNGQIIFISNVPIRKVDKAIKSRTVCLNLHMTKDEISDHMRNIIEAIEPKQTIELKTEVLDYMQEVQEIFGDYNLRTLIKGIRIRSRYHIDEEWKSLIHATAHKTGE